MEIVFTVSKDGTIKDANFIKKSENLNLNLVFLQALNETGGKWRPKESNGERIDTTFKMWGNFFSGAVDKYRLSEIKPLILQHIDNGKYKKAEALVDIALTYVPIDEGYNELKAEILMLSENEKQLKKFLASISVYQYSFVDKFKVE